MAINYASRFEREIQQKFARELTSADLAANKKYNFIDAQTIKVPTVSLSGYKDHARDGSKNRGTVGNTYQSMTLNHDRDIEFFVDDMDVDETNMVLSAANITNTFNEEQAIPELDAYRYSKLYADFVAADGSVNSTILTEENVLSIFDKMMEDMDEAGVPQSGRMLKVTPPVYTMLKNAEKIIRNIDVSAARGINRNVRSLDEVTIVTVPSDRMKTLYDFSNGWAPAVGAQQINMILYHNSAILAPTKVADIYLWGKGETPDSAFGYLYQNRMYTDLFLINAKKDAVAINAYPVGATAIAGLTPTLAAGTSFGTKISAVTPTKGAGNSYLVKINGAMPYANQVLEADTDGWVAYTLNTDFAVTAGNKLALVEIDGDGKAKAGGIATVTAAVVA